MNRRQVGPLVAAGVLVALALAAVVAGAQRQAAPVQACTQALGHEQRWLTNTISSRLKDDTMTVSIRCVWVAK